MAKAVALLKRVPLGDGGTGVIDPDDGTYDRVSTREWDWNDVCFECEWDPIYADSIDIHPLSAVS